MQVIVQDYGVIDFRPEEVYRFDGRTDLTQLRGSIRVNASQDWIKHDYWYDLKDVLVSHSNDLNLVIGLPVLTEADLAKEQQQQEQLCNKCGKLVVECGEENGVPKPGVDSGLYLSAEDLKRILEDMVQDGDNWKYNTSQWASLPDGDESLYVGETDSTADDTDIEEEIQRVLQAMREQNLLYANGLGHYKELVKVLGELKEMQTYI